MKDQITTLILLLTITLFSCEKNEGLGDWTTQEISVKVRNLTETDLTKLRLIAIDGNDLQNHINDEDIIKEINFELKINNDTLIVWNPELNYGYIHIILIANEMQSLVNRLDGAGFTKGTSYRSISKNSINTDPF